VVPVPSPHEHRRDGGEQADPALKGPAMTYTLAAVFTAEAEKAAHNELPMSPEMFGIVGLVVFAFLLLVTFAFKSVGTRH
jgi:hypothetical protein